MCQVNTFMFKDGDLDGEKLMEINRIFASNGFDNFYEYSNPKLRNVRRDLRTFACGNFCDCGSVITKKVVVDEMLETHESSTLSKIIKALFGVVDTVYLFAHWYKNNGDIAREKVVLERATHVVPLSNLSEDTYRNLFYNEVLEVKNA